MQQSVPGFGTTKFLINHLVGGKINSNPPKDITTADNMAAIMEEAIILSL